LSAAPQLSVLLIGIGSETCYAELVRNAPEIARRVRATGQLPSADLSRHLSACDLMIQPYPDGASARRTTLIAALAHGRAIVTNAGISTEPFWAETGAVAIVEEGSDAAFCRRVAKLIAEPGLRSRYGSAAAALYHDRFDLRHAIGMLRGQCESR
jgi:glycosyltransferase involved in cell wall biosynthesis